jgi:hypothetical protein
MLTSAAIKSEIAHTAVAEGADEMSYLSNPKAWSRTRKYKNSNDEVIRDYHARGTEYAARVTEKQGCIVSMIILSHDALAVLHERDVHVPGRPWSFSSGATGEAHNLKPQELVFGIAEQQENPAMCLLITPALYFARTGDLWPAPLQARHLLPSWINMLAAGVYQTDGRPYADIKSALLDRGFIESDVLSATHQESLEIGAIVTDDVSYG